MRLRFVLALLLCLVLTFASSTGRLADRGEDTVSLAVLPEEAAPVQVTSLEAPIRIETRRVRQGDTLFGIFSDFGLPENQILALSQTRVDGIDPSRLVAGKSYQIHLRDDRVVQYLYEPDQERMIRVRFDEKGPTLTVEPIPYHVSKVRLRGIIEDSLFAAVDAMGEKPSLAMDIADIFAWQVDFFRDLRRGDVFTVLVEKSYREEEFVRYGKILAAEFVNEGRVYKAFLFRMENGRHDYFDENGDSLRKQFLKAPLRFRRISSGFSKRRLHPVTGRMTAHLGVDYVAPTGTPVMTIGDGKVVLKKRDSVNGRLLKIRHNSVYSSAYAHLNGFARNIKVGSRVRQGQIIGYVGSTGRATGPHLHFAMYRHGTYIDPRKVDVPKASSVPEDQREAFETRLGELNPLLKGNANERSAKRELH